MPNIDEQEAKTIEFSTIGNVNEITGNIPKINRLANEKDILHRKVCHHGGVEAEKKEEITAGTSKSKTFGSISAIKTGAGKRGD